MRLKRLEKIAALVPLGIALLAAPLHAAGTIPLALAVQTDTDGSIASGCQATFYQAGTVATKQNIYSDFGLTQAMANPLSCDQSGRLPMFWIADGLIHVRLTNSSGNPIVDTTMQVLGPSSGGGGGGSTIDPTTIMATGDLKVRYGTGPLSGFVRANGLTIGNGSSGASERANADTQSLWVYLCQNDPNLVVSSGRSGNCLNDFNASKTIALPDWRGRAIAALADMGNSAASWLSATYFGTSVTTLGAASTTTDHITLATANLPPYTPSGSVALGTLGGSTPYVILTPGANVGYGGTATGAQLEALSTALSGAGAFTFTGTPAAGQNSTPFPSVQPTMLATIYLKL
jgi:hypothetical protein